MSNDPQNKVYNSGVLFTCKLVASLILVLLVSATPALAQDLIIEPAADISEIVKASEQRRRKDNSR